MSILCLESGGTKLVAAWADTAGRLLETVKRERRPDEQAPQTLAQLVEMGRELEARHGAPGIISFGFGGIVRRSERRPQVCFHEQGWEEVDGRRFLEEAFGVPVLVENDCSLAALGEAHCGVGLTRGTLFYTTVGTGIGGAIIRHGRLLELGELGEAEIGHSVVEESGPPCACGNRGCLESLCSGPALARLAERVAGLRTDARSLMQSYRQGDPQAALVVEQAASYFGRAFGFAINLLQPDLVVLGGGVMQSNPEFLAAIARRTEPYLFPLFRGRSRFLLSRLEEHAVCQGAAVYARQEQESTKNTK